jgi:hypothetical protein
MEFVPGISKTIEPLFRNLKPVKVGRKKKYPRALEMILIFRSKDTFLIKTSTKP